MITFYGYNKCATCIKAKKMLQEAGVAFKDVNIVIAPPSKTILKQIISSGAYPLKKLFNTSGQLYRSMNIKDKLNTISEDDALSLLADHGKLIKRPIITNGKEYVVGFDEAKIQTMMIAA